ncbi:MAG: transcription antitermination factor NusB [Candidatus Acetothermia bacterium]
MLRHEAREEVLKSLYGTEFVEDEGVIRERVLDDSSYGDQEEFIREIFEGTLEDLERIDELISEFTVGWKVDRLAFLDRNILRMAIYEMLFYDDTPAEVVMNEAIELAKEYGTDNAPEFVNGILDRIWKERSEKEKA